ncbi:uncharacterized protein KY384_006833 [Bacidia gigantensis]|uniref:uncharacterized protein n=1 Tax=Bacidia gigantensis TaxID=2732470 RepID=UPI001D05B479|nr:uncharacterized protein KY384_006833 [Bacidia gigantensis]KAG8527917.1 hypothetical protein KY384_006833 [Bacidia gigantensis]
MIAPNRLYIVTGVFLLAVISLYTLFKQGKLKPELEKLRFDLRCKCFKSISLTGSAPNATLIQSNVTANSTLSSHISIRPHKIMQVSMSFRAKHYADNNDIYERALQTHTAYGQKWGYPTRHLQSDLWGNEILKKSVYSKLLYISTLMATEMAKPSDERIEWLVWYDADTLLLNPQVPWTLFLPPTTAIDAPHAHIHLLITKDRVGFNSGVFLMRVSPWSLKVLSMTIAYPYLLPTNYTNIGDSDQTIFGKVLDRPENMMHRIYQPRGWWNAYDAYEYPEEVVRKGVLNLHFPGGDYNRLTRMASWFRKMEEGVLGLEVPLEETGYVGEVEAYWERVGNATTVLKRASALVKRFLRAENRDLPESVREMKVAYKSLKEVIYDRAQDEELIVGATQRMERALKSVRKEDVQAAELRISPAGNSTLNKGEEGDDGPWWIEVEEWIKSQSANTTYSYSSQSPPTLNTTQKVGIGVAASIVSTALLIFVLSFIWRKKRRQRARKASEEVLATAIDQSPFYLQQKAELEDEDRRKHELEGEGKMVELGGESTVKHEMPAASDMITITEPLSSQFRQELMSEEFAQEIGSP